tara:strand:- start:38 stop:376 length:339 start_codon:yes stop_codon:yes gene_type:complete
MKHIKVIFFVISMTALAGCVTTQTMADRSITQAANYGEYPDDYEQIIKSIMMNKLKDPESAQYQFKGPIKAYLRSAPIAGGNPTVYGYMVYFKLNAKNSYGGYTGFKEYRML